MMIGKVLKKELFKVSAQVHFLYQVTTESTFQNLSIYLSIYLSISIHFDVKSLQSNFQNLVAGVLVHSRGGGQTVRTVFLPPPEFCAWCPCAVADRQF
jgi:hypothetical protein